MTRNVEHARLHNHTGCVQDMKVLKENRSKETSELPQPFPHKVAMPKNGMVCLSVPCSADESFQIEQWRSKPKLLGT